MQITLKFFVATTVYASTCIFERHMGDESKANMYDVQVKKLAVSSGKLIPNVQCCNSKLRLS